MARRQSAAGPKTVRIVSIEGVCCSVLESTNYDEKIVGKCSPITTAMWLMLWLSTMHMFNTANFLRATAGLPSCVCCARACVCRHPYQEGTGTEWVLGLLQLENKVHGPTL